MDSVEFSEHSASGHATARCLHDVKNIVLTKLAPALYFAGFPKVSQKLSELDPYQERDWQEILSALPRLTEVLEKRLQMAKQRESEGLGTDEESLTRAAREAIEDACQILGVVNELVGSGN